MQSKRVIIIVIDACGVGELPDADRYGDRGAATLPNVAAATGGLYMPNCESLGLGNIASIKGVRPRAAGRQTAVGCFGRMAEKAAGKDSTSGHWEIGGVVLDKPFPVFPDGFPAALVKEFESRAGVRTIGNKAASGTQIIDELGEEHLRTKALILYTSADSVFQLAAHEELYPPERQYEICRIARDLLQGQYGVGRVIARPFLGKPGSFQRTAGRRDFSLVPPSDTVFDLVQANGFKTLSIGKIYDLYARRGFYASVEAKNNYEVMTRVLGAVREDQFHQIVMANCVDFDMLWGHRNDAKMFAKGLEDFDRQLGDLLIALRDDDLLLITADHGCDPTIKTSTDHTREYVPLLVYGRKIRKGVNLGTRETFADVACTVAEVFSLEHSLPGKSFLPEVVLDTKADRMNMQELNAVFDHAALGPEVTESDIALLCWEARKYHFCAVAVNPVWVAMAREELHSSDVRLVAAVGFPLGASRTDIKIIEATRAVSDGAGEIDMVANIGWIASGRYDLVTEEISRVRKSLPFNVVLKVIIEAGKLTEEQQVKATRCVAAGGAQFVKTSTGFFGSVTVEQVARLAQAAQGKIGVKAAGGIRTLAQCRELLRAGAGRLGSSASVAIMKEFTGEK